MTHQMKKAELISQHIIITQTPPDKTQINTTPIM